jgi:hypothetical protein
MDFRQQTDFQQVDRRYTDLVQQRDAGRISQEEFETQRQQLMVLDDEGRWWSKAPDGGHWQYHDGSAWIQGTPPSRQEPPPPPMAPPTQAQERARVSTRRRRTPLVLGAMLLVLLGSGVAVWYFELDDGVVQALGGEGETAGPNSPVVEDGALSAEFPTEWKSATGADSEAGQSSWSSFLGGDVGASITSAPDLKGWGASVTVGSYVVASKALAEDYTNGDLVVSGPNDMSGACTKGDARDFKRGSYQGRIQNWSDCRDEPNLNFYTVAAAPEGRECVVVMKLGGFGEAERKLGQHVIDTFEVDCGALPA